MSRTRRIYVLCAVLVLSLAAAAAAPGMDECSAEVSVTLDRQDGSELQFSVEVSSGENCAHIEYDLVIEEQLPNGQAKRVRKIRQVKLDDGSLTEIVEHTLAEGHRMLSYEAKVVECRVCELDP